MSIIGNAILLGGGGGSLPDGDNMGYGSAPLAGYAVVGSAALCEEESE